MGISRLTALAEEEQGGGSAILLRFATRTIHAPATSACRLESSVQAKESWYTDRWCARGVRHVQPRGF